MQILNLFHSKSYECQNSYLVWYLFRCVLLFRSTFSRAQPRDDQFQFNSRTYILLLFHLPSFLSGIWSFHVGFICLSVCLLCICKKCQCIVTEWKIQTQKRIWSVERSRFGLFYNCDVVWESVWCIFILNSFAHLKWMFAFDNRIQYQVVVSFVAMKLNGASGDRCIKAQTSARPRLPNETFGEMSWKDTWDRWKDS